MAEWQILEWDLANPLREELRSLNCTPKNIDLGNTSAIMAPKGAAMTLKALGKLVDSQLQKGATVHANRAEAQFMWVDARASIDDGEEGLSLEDIERIANDPLLHQRLFDAVQSAFREACRKIAFDIKMYDEAMSKPQNRTPLVSQDKNPKTLELVRKIKDELVTAQNTGLQNLRAIQANLPEELAGKQTKLQRLKVGFKIFLGIVAISCCVAGAIATWGVAGGLLAGAAIVAGSRATLDTSKAINDQLIEAETVRRRLISAIELFQKSTVLNGVKRTVEALANSTIKTGAVGYNILGIGKFASLSDVAEDVELYSQKLCTIRAQAHELSGNVSKALTEMDNIRNMKKVPKTFQSTMKVKIVPEASTVARQAWADKTITRSKKELELHALLTKIPKFHLACDAHLQALPGLKAAVNQVVESKGKTYLLLEKWLDLSVNVFLTTVGTTGGIATWGGWSDTFTVLGGLDDLYSEVDQGVSGGQSSRFENS